MASNTFTFTIDFVAHILSMAQARAHIHRLRGIAINWKLRITSYEWNMCVFLFPSLFLALPWTIWMWYTLFVATHFSFFCSEKRLHMCVWVPVCLTFGMFEVCHVYSMILIRKNLSLCIRFEAIQITMTDHVK